MRKPFGCSLFGLDGGGEGFGGEVLWECSDLAFSVQTRGYKSVQWLLQLGRMTDAGKCVSCVKERG